MPGTLVITTLSDGTNSTSATNPIRGSAKAWVNFNGTGTPAIRSSYNISSVTKNSTAVYTITFSTAMPNTNYAATGIAGRDTGGSAQMVVPQGVQTTTACILGSYVWNASQDDPNYFSVAIFSS